VEMFYSRCFDRPLILSPAATIATDGSRLIVFGGVNIKNQYSSRLFFLNLGNFTWTEGTDAGAINARSSHVCATNGDSFVVWGGKVSTDQGKKAENSLETL